MPSSAQPFSNGAGAAGRSIVGDRANKDQQALRDGNANRTNNNCGLTIVPLLLREQGGADGKAN